MFILLAIVSNWYLFPNFWVYIDLLWMHTPCIWGCGLQPMKLYVEINLATFPQVLLDFCLILLEKPNTTTPLELLSSESAAQWIKHWKTLNTAGTKSWVYGLGDLFQLMTVNCSWRKKRLRVKVPLCSQESLLLLNNIFVPCFLYRSPFSCAFYFKSCTFDSRPMYFLKDSPPHLKSMSPCHHIGMQAESYLSG